MSNSSVHSQPATDAAEGLVMIRYVGTWAYAAASTKFVSAVRSK